jgi:hypothetical protein
MTLCFPHCGCNCNSTDTEFDTIIQAETRLELSLHQLASSNIGWFCDFDDLKFCDWKISKTSGVYALWHKDEYCPTHEIFHCRALYVGKGYVKTRIFDHALKKDFGDAQLVYFSYVEIPNRHAKYVEQLLLDLYDFPLNTSENSGTGKLCYYMTQAEVDFGSLG